MALARYLAPIVLVLLACTTTSNAQALEWTDILAPAGTFDTDLNNFNILTALADYANLTTAVLGLRSSTVFAPTDGAFIGLANTLTPYKGQNESIALQSLMRFAMTSPGLKGAALVQVVLLYHVVPYPMSQNHIVRNSYFAHTLFKGNTILLTKSIELVDGNSYIINPVVFKSDIRVVNNNIVHVINGVLVPDLTGP